MTELYDQCKNLLTEIDMGLMDGGETEKTAITLLASEICGTNESELSELLGIDETDIQAMGRRFRENHVWDGEGVAAHDWHDPEDGGLSFLLDVMIGEGKVHKKWDSAAGQWSYAMTDSGKSYVESNLLE